MYLCMRPVDCSWRQTQRARVLDANRASHSSTVLLPSPLLHWSLSVVNYAGTAPTWELGVQNGETTFERQSDMRVEVLQGVLVGYTSLDDGQISEIATTTNNKIGMYNVLIRNCQLAGYLLYQCIRVPVASFDFFEGLQHIPSSLVPDVVIRRCHEFATLHISKITESAHVHCIPTLLGTFVLGLYIAVGVAIISYALFYVGTLFTMALLVACVMGGLFTQGTFSKF
ncbi:hypothetical protein P171DRAFT_237640 [Karstenula rhodostoma CBS 690.94]|uniref:Uncharacterized protein n=1 Tax=Karstenula rhodostoma CBS 690.94 TaxID=1392251 RepID=A0A9P4PPN0_9PLEO|nr:hypothetical protein P171DRAFT_237640 [Karstenula rhodostoma CBS 690.94]